MICVMCGTFVIFQRGTGRDFANVELRCTLLGSQFAEGHFVRTIPVMSPEERLHVAHFDRQFSTSRPTKRHTARDRGKSVSTRQSPKIGELRPAEETPSQFSLDLAR
jgi:hypothetical protein